MWILHKARSALQPQRQQIPPHFIHELLSEHLESSSKSPAFRVYLLLSIKAKQSGWHSSEVLNTYQGDARRAQLGYVF